MTTYCVYFILPHGNQLCLTMIWEHKHKTERQFELDIRSIEESLNCEYLYKEEKTNG